MTFVENDHRKNVDFQPLKRFRMPHYVYKNRRRHHDDFVFFDDFELGSVRVDQIPKWNSAVQNFYFFYLAPQKSLENSKLLLGQWNRWGEKRDLRWKNFLNQKISFENLDFSVKNIHEFFLK